MTDKPVILIVEDESMIRDLAESVLEEHGFRVLSVPSADRAWALMSVILPDLLFADVVLPGDLDGVALARAVRSRDPSVKIVLATGHASRVSAALLEGGPPVLRKPYSPPQLIRELENALAA